MNLSKPCYCHSGTTYQNCCYPFHQGIDYPSTTQELLKSRYSAYALCMADYIKKTMIEPALLHFNRDDIVGSSTEWLELNIYQQIKGSKSDHEGSIIFDVFYKLKPDLAIEGFKEHSFFVKQNGKWVYKMSLSFLKL